MLIVDDEIAIQRLIARFLANAGFRVETASNVAQALEAVSRQTFGLALCDMRMPGGSGLDFTLSALKIDATLPIVLLSGAVDDQTRAELLAAGACGVLDKPVEARSLVNVVKIRLRATS